MKKLLLSLALLPSIIWSREIPTDILQEEINQAVASSSATPIEIQLKEPTYYLTKSLIIDETWPEIKIKGSNSQICGGRAYNDLQWKKEGKRWTTTLPLNLNIRSVKIGSEYYIPARFPNYKEKSYPFNGTTTETNLKSHIKKWNNPSSGYLHALHRAHWGDYHFSIERKNGKRLKLKGGWQNNRPEHPYNRQVLFVENIEEELDAKGEYFYNNETGILSFIAISSSFIPNAETIVETAELDELIIIRGENKKSAGNVTLEGLSFSLTAPTFMKCKEPLLRSDWMIYRSGAILIENATKVIIKDCNFTQLGGNGVFVSKKANEISITGSLFKEIGASGVCFVGDPSSVRSPLFNYHKRYSSMQDATPGPQNDLHPINCSVSNSLFHRTGRIEKQSAGVQISMSSKITVSHCTIFEVPRAGINVSEGTFGGHLIENNDVFDTVLETSDHGAFNSWGRDRFWDKDRNVTDKWVAQNKEFPLADVVDPIILRNNRFHCEHGWDIDLDDGSSNYLLENNLCLTGGIKLREGFFRTVRNNIMVNNSFHPHVWYGEDDSDIFTANIVFKAYAPIRLGGKGKMIDKNFFHLTKIAGQAFSNWDNNSISGDALFINPKIGDYRVKDQSKALAIGFKNFPMDQFGVTSSRLKKLAKSPISNLKSILSTDSNRSNIILEWGDLRFRNLIGMGEQSAAGIGSETGVLVLNPTHNINALTLTGLQTDDLILKLENQTIHSTEDLKQAVGQLNLNKKIKAVIYRDQTEIQVNLDFSKNSEKKFR